MRVYWILTALLFAPLMQARSEPVLLWGDTHVHTSISFDAFLNNNRSAGPEVAYRFARGEPVIHPLHRARVQIDKPLDFLVVADHAEYYGVGREVYFNGAQLPEDAGLLARVEGWFTQRELRKLIDGDGGWDAFVDLLPRSGDPAEAAGELWNNDDREMINAPALEAKTWNEATALADRYNVPGEFTALIGWEWSSLPGGANLHRVVFTSADGETARRFQPFGSDDSPFPEDLWAWLEKTSAETGAEFVAIPHNSNISKGFMFAESSLRGEPYDAEAARQRLQWEPVVEITQIKGDSETHPVFSPRDEFADFETYTYYIQQEVEAYVPRPGDFVRPALKLGLELESRIGVNPYQFGLIGSTDAHTSLSTAEEDNFGGKFPGDSIPEGKTRSDGKGGVASGWSMSAQGLAAVWAAENSREAILEAFRRREVYATTGPRIALRFFGGWQFNEADADAADAELRERGVAMGSVLAPAVDERRPRFVVQALKDPGAANLDRIQIVKGWVDAQGEAQERVYNVAWSGKRVLGINGTLPAVVDTVDRRTGRHSDRNGAASLSTVWRDPAFDPAQRAFYYARVLQVPTARHVFLDALALGKDAPDEGAAVIQERAYSSPIWYRPQ